MRKLFMLLPLLAGLNATAQQYIPFPTGNAEWRYRQYNDNGTSGRQVVKDLLFYTNGTDSIINSVSYVKVFMRYHADTFTVLPTPLPAVVNSVASAPDIYYAAFRENNKRIYIIDHNDTAEHLYYDFNLQTGDTLHSANIACNNAIVKGFDSVLINGHYQKRIIYSTHWSSSSPDVYMVEGSGPIQYPVFNMDNGQTKTYLHCFTSSTGTYTPDTFNCTYIFPYGTPTAINPAATQTETGIYPNPFSKELYVTASKNVHVFIYNAIGVKMYDGITAHTIPVTNEWPAGIYSAIVKDTSGNIIATKKLMKE